MHLQTRPSSGIRAEKNAEGARGYATTGYHYSRRACGERGVCFVVVCLTCYASIAKKGEFSTLPTK